MKKVTVILIGLFLMTFAFQSVNAQSAAATTSSSATIVQAISIVKTINRDLDFGIFTAVDGTVTIANTDAGTRSSVGPVLNGGNPSSAEFTVTGSAAQTYSVDVTDQVTLTSTTDNTQTMTLDVLSSIEGIGVGTLSGTTGDATPGTDKIYVGGTLNVLGTNTAGLYFNAADLTVTVNYN